MNKTLFKIFAGFLCLSSVPAYAWEEIGSDGESNYSVNLKDMKYLDGRHTKRQAWFVIKAEQNSEIMKKGQYTLSLNSFDCENDRFRIDKFTIFSSTDKVIKRMEQSTGWLDTEPGSRYDQLAYAVCSYE